MTDLDQALRYAKKGEALLFTGAGFSFGAKNLLPVDNKIPTAEAFSRMLASSLGVDGSYQLPAISQFYTKEKGGHDLVRVLLETFSVSEVADHHVKIAAVKWRRVYTTNYDNLFEFAARKSGEEWVPLTVSSEPSASPRKCIHINGHISNLTIETLDHQIKLTHSSYSADAFALSQWSQQLRQDMNASKAIFFVGYSLADIDVSRILYEMPDLRDRTHFVVSTKEDPVSRSILERYGTIHSIGVQAFAELLDKAEVSSEHEDHALTWLVKYSEPANPVAPDDLSSHDLILKGVLSPSMLVWSLADPNSHYVVRRTRLDEILLEIKNGRKWLLVHSDLGNGKSILKAQLSYVLNRANYEVYWDSDLDISKRDDVAHLAKRGVKMAFMIDEDSERFSAIDLFKTFEFQDACFVIFVRSTAFYLGEHRYEDHLPEGFAEFDINRLDDAEVRHFVANFNLLGLWGDLANLSTMEKENRLRVAFERSIQKLILAVFEQSEMGRRVVAEATNIISTDGAVADVLTLSFVLTRLQHYPSPTILSELLPDMDVWRLVRSPQFKKAGEFIRFENGVIRSRSSILSEVVLRSAIRPDNLIKLVEKVVRHLGGKKRTDAMHDIFRQLMRFPTLEGMIADSRKREIIISYFQSIKDLSFCQNSADFWLHYAMARLSFGEFDVSTRYFATAKRLAQGNPKKSSDVNNHFARLLLDSRIRTDEYADYFRAFEAAHGILINQMNRDDNRHYPYRQAKKYVEFISYRKDKLTEDELKRFIVACRQVKAAIKNMTSRISFSGEIAECDRQMDRAIDIAQRGPSV